MGEQYSKRKLPNLIIIEGFWNIGKTTLINYVKETNKLIYINEPDHLKDNIQKDILDWYIKKHGERLNAAIENIKNNNKVIMERSLISDISYQYAKSGKILPKYTLKLKKIRIIGDVSIIFLYGSRKFILKQSKDIKDTDTRDLILKKEFYNRYLEFYLKILPKHIHINSIKIDKVDSFKRPEKILSLFYRQFPLLEKKLAVCSSIVAYHKDKVLLIYDHKYKHYILPQGHKEASEKLNETALRETTEETGFTNLRVIKKIRKYQYHYPTKNKIIYKSIHVYLLEILSLSRVKKPFENHENYSNKFFTFDNAIKNLRWPQDKKVTKEALKYIKSPHSKRVRTLNINRCTTTN